jgi:hypothetical protein
VRLGTRIPTVPRALFSGSSGLRGPSTGIDGLPGSKKISSHHGRRNLLREKCSRRRFLREENWSKKTSSQRRFGEEDFFAKKIAEEDFFAPDFQ